MQQPHGVMAERRRPRAELA